MHRSTHVPGGMPRPLGGRSQAGLSPLSWVGTLGTGACLPVASTGRPLALRGIRTGNFGVPLGAARVSAVRGAAARCPGSGIGATRLPV